MVLSFGSGAMTNSLADIYDADVIFLTGANPSDNHPILALMIKEAVENGTTLIVADPKKIELVEYANFWLNMKPGTDIALYNAMAYVIIKEKLYDEKFIEERTKDFEKLKENIGKYTPEWAEKITGVSAKTIRAAARAYATAERAAIFYCMGVTQHATGTENVWALLNLALLTGNFGKKGVGFNPIRGQSNVQGACDMGCLPILFPGYQFVNDQNAVERLKEIWQVDSIPSEFGLTMPDMIDGMLEGTFKALWIMGADPLMTFPNIKRARKALNS